MPRVDFKIRRRVWVGLGAALIGVILWAYLFNTQRLLPAPSGSRSQPFVQLAGAGAAVSNKILQERAELMDPTPLFFPTEWNYGQRPLLGEQQQQRGQVFGSFEPKLTLGEQNLTPYGLETVPTPEKLSDVLAQGNEAPFAGLGQVDRQRATLPIRAGYLEIRRIGIKEPVIEQTLTGFDAPRSDFSPMEFLLVVGSAGLIGDPIVMSGSGWDEVDGFFRTYLVKSYHVGERLAPGRYLVVVGS